jgi:Skp family chaperone for outer membrane proteins
MNRTVLSLVVGIVVFSITLSDGVSVAQAQKLDDDSVTRLIRENERLKSENKRLQKQLQASGQASSATAVVDLKRTYDSLREKLKIESQFQAREEVFSSEKEKREAKVKQLSDALSDLQLGTPEYNNIQEQLESAQADYAVWVRLESGKINRDRAAWIKEIYGKMLENIGKVAKEKGYDLVLFKVPDIDFSEVKSEQVSKMIQTRKVLWSIEELDLTDFVIQRMNLAYTRSGG